MYIQVYTYMIIFGWIGWFCLEVDVAYRYRWLDQHGLHDAKIGQFGTKIISTLPLMLDHSTHYPEPHLLLLYNIVLFFYLVVFNWLPRQSRSLIQYPSPYTSGEISKNLFHWLHNLRFFYFDQSEEPSWLQRLVAIFVFIWQWLPELICASKEWAGYRRAHVFHTNIYICAFFLTGNTNITVSGHQRRCDLYSQCHVVRLVYSHVGQVNIL